MSTKYVRELLESVDVLNHERAYERIGEALQELRQVEAARAKDAELIQQLVDALQYLGDIGVWYPDQNEALNAALKAGFKPSDR